jgi:PadR family transcriptional regulator, regulatory protein PadR
MARRPLGEFEQTLLYAVLSLQDAEDGANGSTIRKLIQKQIGRVVSPGAVHTAFVRLEERGYVQSELGEPTPERGGKRKRQYRLAAAGLAALRSAEANLSRMARLVRARS